MEEVRVGEGPKTGEDGTIGVGWWGDGGGERLDWGGLYKRVRMVQ
jgi:hypothetical protein